MNRKGFTLLELTTVAAVLAILAAIAIPRISRSLKNAQDRECQATRLITTRADQRYASEHEGKHSLGIDDLLKSGYLQTRPRCTGGGTYAWVPELNGSKGERRLICSVHGDSLPDMPENAPTPPTPPAGGNPPGNGSNPGNGNRPGNGNNPGSGNRPGNGNGPGGGHGSGSGHGGGDHRSSAAPPASAADCPPGTDYIPKTYIVATKTFTAACAPKCAYGQIRVPSWSMTCKTPTCVAGYRWDQAALNCVR